MRCTLCLDLDDWSGFDAWDSSSYRFPEAFTRTDGRVGRYRAGHGGSRPVGLRTRRFQGRGSSGYSAGDQDDGIRAAGASSRRLGAASQAKGGVDLARCHPRQCRAGVTFCYRDLANLLTDRGTASCFRRFHATVPIIDPQVLSEERDYTRALSLSRIAYDLENLFSPALAAILLVWISFHGLFVGTSFGFALSAGLIVTTVFPTTVAGNRREALGERMLRGMRIYLRTPRLRGLLALNLCAAAGGAMVFVNTIVIVRELLGGDEQQLALALAVFGGGSMLAALLLPKALDRLPDRQVMLSSAIAMVVMLLTLTMLWVALPSLRGWAMSLPAWGLMGIAYAGLVTPGGRLIRRSAHNEDLPSVFAAQFSFSHVCWLLAYPLAGWVG